MTLRKSPPNPSRPTPGRQWGRPAWFTAVLAVTLVGSAVVPAQQPASPSQVGRSGQQEGRQISLEDQLRIGLKAITLADKAFLNRVVLLVQQGKLPRSLVDSTFLWARSKAVYRKGRNPLRPIVYFEPALVLRARRLGIQL